MDPLFFIFIFWDYQLLGSYYVPGNELVSTLYIGLHLVFTTTPLGQVSLFSEAQGGK